VGDEGNSILREKLSALAGTPIAEHDAVKLLTDVINAGFGVTLDLDEGNRYKLVRRDGRFTLKKEERARPSTIPPKPIARR
jgi:hypothetical protein